jgi:aspartate/methionine/tyrosine aminotransferase
MVTTGGIHALYIICQALLEPGDEVLVPDPEWPPCLGNVTAAHGVPVAYPLHEALGWRFDIAELRPSKVTAKTRAIYVNSPNNPTGGVLTREDLEAVAALCRERDLWLISDEAYEDVVFDGEHVSPASLPGMYERTIPFYTFSKSYAMTGLRLGYVAARDPKLRERMKKVLFYTASNIASVVQYGGIGALEGSQEMIESFRSELQARRDLFYEGIREHAGGVLSGRPPAGAFYAFLRIDPAWGPGETTHTSISWALAEHLISKGRIGCVPGVDFGSEGEGFIRFCFARDRAELSGALASMGELFS